MSRQNWVSAAALLLLLVIGVAGAGEAQTPTERPLPLDLERVTIRARDGSLDILARHDELRRPVLVILPGSVCMSAFMLVQQSDGVGAVTTVMPPAASDLAARGVHLAILERRNIRSFDHVYSPADASRLPYVERHACSDVNGGVTLEQRVSDVQTQLEYLRQQPWVGEILIAGISEGADVATAVAATSTNIRALLLIMGAGMSQFFDSIHQRRLDGDEKGVAKVFADLDAFLSGKPPETFQDFLRNAGKVLP